MRTQAAEGTPLETPVQPLQARHELRALLHGDLRQLSPLVSKAMQGLAARYYLRGCTEVGRHVKLRGRPFVYNRGRILIGERVNIHSTTVRCEFVTLPGGCLEIGPRTFVNYGCSFSAHQLVRIGADCLIGPYVNILDNNYHEVLDRKRTPPSRPVIIGDNVWIAARVVILPGVTIGDHAVIGVGSIVREDVPARSIVAASAARIVSTF